MTASGPRVLAAWGLAMVGACKETPPPINFHSAVDAQVLAARVDAAGADVPADVVRFQARQGVAFQEAVAEVSVEGAVVTAPEGERFAASLTLDLDGDGVASDVAVARVRADGTGAGLSLHRREGQAFVVTALDAARPEGVPCGAATLRQTSARSLVLRWRCVGGGADAGVGAPEGAAEVVLVGLGESPAVWGRASLAGPLPATSLELDAEATDRDGDGNDEMVVTVTAGRPGRRGGARGRFVYFQRGGGLARDTAEPGASLSAVREGARRGVGRRRAGTLAALAALDDLARLRRAVCAESGVAVLRLGSARGVACGEGAFAGVADVAARALSALGEHPSALGLAGDDAGPWGAASESAVAALGRAVPVDRRATLREGPFGGTDLSTLAPLHLGHVRLETAQNPVAAWLRGPVTGRVDLATLAFAPGDPGQVADIQPRSPDGTWRFVGAVERCDGVAAVTCPAAEPGCPAEGLRAGQTALPPGARLHALDELPGPGTTVRCLRDPGAVQALPVGAVVPLGWGPRGLLLARRGRLWRVAGAGEATPVWTTDALGAPWPAGSAVNEAGTVLTLATPDGLWVRERTGWRRLGVEALAGRTGQLDAMTVSNDGRTLVGMLGTRVMVVQRR